MWSEFQLDNSTVQIKNIKSPSYPNYLANTAIETPPKLPRSTSAQVMCLNIIHFDKLIGPKTYWNN